MRNETASQLEREDQARQEIEGLWRCTLQPLDPHLYCVDWAIFKEEKLFIGWAEYKYRGQSTKGEPMPWGKYPSVILSLGKWIQLKHLGEKSHRYFYLFVEWSDCITYGKWPPFTGMGYPIQYGIELGGRSDRGQAADREPVIVIPNSEFKVIGQSVSSRASTAGIPAPASGDGAGTDQQTASREEPADRESRRA